MFRITNDPSSGSDNLYFEITCIFSQMFIMCVVGVWRHVHTKTGWNCSSILTLLGSGHQKPARNLPVPNVQQKTLDDGQRRCPKHVEFYNRIKIGIVSASGLLFKKKAYWNVVLTLCKMKKLLQICHWRVCICHVQSLTSENNTKKYFHCSQCKHKRGFSPVCRVKLV